MRRDIILFLSLIGLVGCGFGKKSGDSNDRGAPVVEEPATEDPSAGDPNAGGGGNNGGAGQVGGLTTSYSIQPFSGSRSEALSVAGSLALSTSVDFINGSGSSAALRLFGGEDYDSFQTSTMSFDASLKSTKELQSALCVLNKLNYQSLPKNEQSVTAEIGPCFPKAQKGSQSSASSSSSSSSASSSSSSSTAQTSSTITYTSFLNADSKLIVDFSFTEAGTNEWDQDKTVKIVFVISEGVSVSNPFGSFSMLTTKSYVGGGEYSKSEMIVSAGEANANGQRTAAVQYIKDSGWAGYERMGGYFLIGTDGADLGKVIGGHYRAAIEGWDPESGEPGGLYNVAFNKDRLLREKTIENVEEMFGPDFVGTINTDPIQSCYLPKAFNTITYGYRVFNGDGSAVSQDNKEFEFATSNQTNAIRGWAGYWGTNVWTNDGTEPNLANLNGTTVYKVDWNNWDDTTGMPGLTNEAFTLSIGEGKLSRYSSVAIDTAKLDGRPMDWVWDDQSSRSVRIVWSEAEQRFYKTAYWQDAVSTDPNGFGGGGEWVEMTPEIFTPSYDIYTWNDAIGGEIQIRIDFGTGSVTEVVKRSHEILNNPGDLILVCSAYNCPKEGGIDAATLMNDWSAGYYQDDTAREYQFNGTNFTLNYNGQAVALTGAGEESMYTNLWVDRLYLKADYDAASGNTADIDTYYTYETGLSSWSKSIQLIRQSDSTPVTFDPPVRIEYLAALAELCEGENTDKVGKFYNLEINNDFLNMPWEPNGYRTDPMTGEKWEDWAPALCLNNGVVLTDSNSNTYKIKADFVEKRMRETTLDDCGGLEFRTDITLPERKSLVLPQEFAHEFHSDDTGAGAVYAEDSVDPMAGL